MGVDYKKAQVDMVDKVLAWSGVTNSDEIQSVLDVGCGLGGSTRHIQRMFPGARCVGISLSPGQVERARQLTEQFLLNRICDIYVLPQWCSLADYKEIFSRHGLTTDLRSADWSREVAPFWRAVIDTALTRRGVSGLFKAGVNVAAAALAMPLMTLGLKSGTVRFVLLSAVKE